MVAPRFRLLGFVVVVAAVVVVLVGVRGPAQAEPPRCKPPRILHKDECLYPEDVEKLAAAARAKRPKAAQRTPANQPTTPLPPEPTPPGGPQLASAAQLAALGLRWVDFASGTFPMGSDYGDPDERPVRTVKTRTYRLAATEVTVAAYRACADAGWCEPDNVDGEQWLDHAFDASRFCNYPQPERGSHPMNCVNWWQAEQFCAWIGGRLPTEAEWERAATAGSRMYPWGDQPATCTYAAMNNGVDGCGAAMTAPVCERPPGRTPDGICDLAGNVWEWVSDWYGAGHYAENVADDPQGPAFGSARVRRGGSFRDQPGDLRGTNRWYLGSVYRSAQTGFRCASD